MNLFVFLFEFASASTPSPTTTQRSLTRDHAPSILHGLRSLSLFLFSCVALRSKTTDWVNASNPPFFCFRLLPPTLTAFALSLFADAGSRSLLLLFVLFPLSPYLSFQAAAKKMSA